jgi:hypothetical protein
MTSIERTVYRWMKRSYATKELIEAYTPTDEERRFVNTMTRAALMLQNVAHLSPYLTRHIQRFGDYFLKTWHETAFPLEEEVSIA